MPTTPATPPNLIPDPVAVHTRLIEVIREARLLRRQLRVSRAAADGGSREASPRDIAETTARGLTAATAK